MTLSHRRKRASKGEARKVPATRRPPRYSTFFPTKQVSSYRPSFGKVVSGWRRQPASRVSFQKHRSFVSPRVEANSTVRPRNFPTSPSRLCHRPVWVLTEVEVLLLSQPARVCQRGCWKKSSFSQRQLVSAKCNTATTSATFRSENELLTRRRLRLSDDFRGDVGLRCIPDDSSKSGVLSSETDGRGETATAAEKLRRCPENKTTIWQRCVHGPLDSRSM